MAGLAAAGAIKAQQHFQSKTCWINRRSLCSNARLKLDMHMARPAKVTRVSKATREKIIKAASRAFALGGYEGASRRRCGSQPGRDQLSLPEQGRALSRRAAGGRVRADERR